jgi:hypothetical protein
MFVLEKQFYILNGFGIITCLYACHKPDLGKYLSIKCDSSVGIALG